VAGQRVGAGLNEGIDRSASEKFAGNSPTLSTAYPPPRGALPRSADRATVDKKDAIRPLALIAPEFFLKVDRKKTGKVSPATW